MLARSRTGGATDRTSLLFRPLDLRPASLMSSCCAASHQVEPRTAESAQLVLDEVSKLWSMTNPHNLEFFMKSVMARDKRSSNQEDLLKKLEAAIEQISRCDLPEGLREVSMGGPMIPTDSVDSFEFMLGRNRKRLVGFGEQTSNLFRGIASRGSEDGGSDLSTPPSTGNAGARTFEPIKAAFNWQQHEFGTANTTQRKERLKTPFELSSVSGVWVKDEDASDKATTDLGFCTKKWAKQIARMNASALKMDVGLEHFEHSYRTFGFFHSSEKYFWNGHDCDTSSTSCDPNIRIKLTSTGWTKRITWSGSDQELKETYRVSLDGQTLIATTTLQANGESLIRRNVYKRRRGGWLRW